MNKCSLILADEFDSELLGRQLANYCLPPLVLTLSGEIGMGKTTFVRALLRALGIHSAIKSPTFSLVETYQCNKFLFHHFDLYRIQDVTELEYIGFRDYFLKDTVCCIEWPEHGKELLEKSDLNFNFSLYGKGRLVEISASSAMGKTILSCL